MKMKVKSVIQRILAGALALVFAGTIALPKAEAVTGVDDVSVGIMAVLVHLDSIGGSLAVQQGTALATQNAVTALATQAGAAGALGAGVTGTAALATIGSSVAAFAGGYTIGYVGYEMLTKLAEWIRQSKLTGTAENKIWVTGGDGNRLVDGTYIGGVLTGNWPLILGNVYTTQLGSSFWVNYSEVVPHETYSLSLTTISTTNIVQKFERLYHNSDPLPPDPSYHHYTISVGSPYADKGKGWVLVKFSGGTYRFPEDYSSEPIFKDVFTPAPSGEEKQEVTFIPPSTWAPPAPAPGQDVYYNPYPRAPQKPIKDMVEDVPKDIYDKKFDPAPPQVIEPTVPPVNPDLPPVVNPNPPVDPPAEVQPYTVQLGDVFPFCIPFDLYHMVTLFVAEPEAPHAKWEFSLPFAAGTYKVEWDLQEWDEVAALCRKLELVLFCVGLAVVTSKLIKW